MTWEVGASGWREGETSFFCRSCGKAGRAACKERLLQPRVGLLWRSRAPLLSSGCPAELLPPVLGCAFIPARCRVLLCPPHVLPLPLQVPLSPTASLQWKGMRGTHLGPTDARAAMGAGRHERPIQVKKGDVAFVGGSALKSSWHVLLCKRQHSVPPGLFVRLA